jgi:hypothetical protein
VGRRGEPIALGEAVSALARRLRNPTKRHAGARRPSGARCGEIDKRVHACLLRAYSSFDAQNGYYSAKGLLANLDAMESLFLQWKVSFEPKVFVPNSAKAHQALWKKLVPGEGRAPTLDAEVIRLSGKLSREAIRNGNANWRPDTKKAWEFLFNTLLAHYEGKVAQKELGLLRRRVVGKKSDRVEFHDRIQEYAVHFATTVKPKPFPAAGYQF